LLSLAATHIAPGIESLSLDTLVQVLDALPVPAFVVEQHMLYCNRQIESLTGYDRTDLSSYNSFFILLFGNWADRARYMFETDLDSGFPDPRDYSIICSDGSAKVVKMFGSISQRVICTMQDITEQKLTQRALRESEERYRFLSGLTSDYVYCCTRQGNDPFRIQWLGGAIEEITGFSDQEIYESGCWLPLVHREDRARVAAAKMSLKAGESRTDEFRIVCKDGRVCWIREFSRCEAGEVEGELRLHGASQNITDSKKSEIALQNRDEIFRLFLEYCPAYLMFKDENHRILRLSRNFETLLGKPLSELEGKTPAEIFPPKLAAKVMKDDQKVLTDGGLIQVEEKLHDRYYSSIKFSIPQKNKPPRIVTMRTDITEHKEAQEALSRMNEMLDRLVAERTSELERAIREQESFSYSVSHDLRAPLRHINCFSAIVLEDYSECLPEDGRQYLNRICEATKRLGELIDDLLKLSQLSRVPLNRVPVNISAVAAKIGTMFKEMEPRRRVAFEVMPGLIASCDKGLVRQLLENLIGNAWKYTSNVAEPRIVFGMKPSRQGAVYFVKDNGAGFSMNYKDKLFLPFQRLHGAEYEGNGIGLATVQRIVQRHGGNIWAEGAEGEGATFYFTLPIQKTSTQSSLDL
jgi:PAS domain S-box-containing protein